MVICVNSILKILAVELLNYHLARVLQPMVPQQIELL